MRMRKKIVLLGDSTVGKTSLIRRFVFDAFEDSYIATVGSKVSRKDVQVETSKGPVDLTLMVWDILGRQGYTATHARSFAGVHGAVLVADLTRRETLESLERYWIPSLLRVVESVPLVFVSNKADLTRSYAFAPEDMARLASKHNVGLADMLPEGLATSHATSARTGANVNAAFESLGHLLASGKAPEDPIKDLYESLVATGILRTTDKSAPVGALDAIIADFCEQAQAEFEDDRSAMIILRQELIRAGVDVRDPAKESILRVVDYLAEAETDYKDEATVKSNRVRRRQWAAAVSGL